eukprot:982553_1
MPEATIICCDCSEYMRNGDFHPSRFDQQSDAVSLISNAKTQQNHENTVGLIAMHPNAKADVLVNCTQDIGRVLSSLSKMRIGDNTLIKPSSAESKTIDSINILVALQTAQLALKHRKNKKCDQRIILFVGSPITKAQSEKLLIKAAKRLKKNNVSVDIVNFGETEDNTDLLQRFITAVKGANDNSNLVTVEPGKLLSDVLISTPIFAQGSEQINEYAGLGNDADLNAAIRASQADSGGGMAADFGGVDPNTDPELAMALRMSMEEERQRQEAEAKKAAEAQQSASGGDAASASVDNEAAADVAMEPKEVEKKPDDKEKVDVGGDVGNMAEVLDIDDDDEELLKALQMNMAEVLDIDDDDEELLKALQMSMEDNDEDNDIDMQQNNDANFVDELLNDLPGIDQNDLDEIGTMEDLLASVDDEDEDVDVEKDNEKEKKKKEDDK